MHVCIYDALLYKMYTESDCIAINDSPTPSWSMRDQLIVIGINFEKKS